MQRLRIVREVGILIFNRFCEEIIWTNYGGAMVTLLGRDVVVFIIGYLTHLAIEAIIEMIKEG